MVLLGRITAIPYTNGVRKKVVRAREYQILVFLAERQPPTIWRSGYLRTGHHFTDRVIGVRDT